MNCPACGKAMTEQNFMNVKVDVCAQGCGGQWFDWMELIRLDESDEGNQGDIAAVLNTPPVHDENRARINCPKCGLVMHRHKYTSSREVDIDECYQCGGYFLDAGELAAIRKTFMSEQEELKFCESLMAHDKTWSEAAEDLEKRDERAQAAKKMTRFMRLSYYATGK